MSAAGSGFHTGACLAPPRQSRAEAPVVATGWQKALEGVNRLCIEEEDEEEDEEEEYSGVNSPAVLGFPLALIPGRR